MNNIFSSSGWSSAWNTCTSYLYSNSSISPVQEPHCAKEETHTDINEENSHSDADFTFIEENDVQNAVKDVFDQINSKVRKDNLPLENSNLIKNYIEQHCPGYKVREVEKLAKTGQERLSQILDGDLTAASLTATNENAELAVTQIVMYLMIKAAEKNQGFEEGTFVVEDPNGFLYSFLSELPQVYNRISSHFKGISPHTHRGFDVLQAPQQMKIETQAQYALPAGKMTILFSRLHKQGSGKQLTFIKPENYGCNTITHNLLHGYEFLVAAARKLLPGADQAKGMRKERIPHAILKDFKKFSKEFFSAVSNKAVSAADGRFLMNFLENNAPVIAELGMPLKAQANSIHRSLERVRTPMDLASEIKQFFDAYQNALIKSSKVFGLQLMHRFIQMNDNLLAMGLVSENNYRQMHRHLYANDNISIRFGGEVSFLNSELRNPIRHPLEDS